MTWGQRRTLIIVLVIVAFLGIVWTFSRGPSISSNSVLVLDLDGPIVEQRPADFSSALFGSHALVLHEITDALDQAASDSRIKGLIVRIAPLETGWGKLEEIRSYLLAFRASRKPSLCYLGYDGIENPEYYVATACDQVWLTPSNTIGVRGMMAEALFLRGSLDKLKIVPDMYHIAEYKAAINQFTEKKFTPAHREEVQSLLTSAYDQYLADVSAARHMGSTKFASLVEQGPFLAQDALKEKLVDRLAYWDEVQNYFTEKTGEWSPLNFSQYRLSLSDGFGPRIAVVYATGEIVSGDSQVTPGGNSLMGGDSVARDLRQVRQDSSIKAIVLRVDSPGGSALASEVIRREVQLARKDKPVVVSMSDVAASGGYWISMSADKIVADPETITASIGVLSGKFNLSGLYQMLGLSTDFVATSENATMYSDQQNFTPAQQQVVQKMLADVYTNFTHGVADGRKMQLAAVEKIAKGRVWSGEDARQIGLVDDLGGLDRAITVAKGLAHIPATQSVQIVRTPKPKTLLDLFLERAEDQTLAPQNETSAIQGMLHRLLAMVRAEPVRVQMPFSLTIR
ncbi:MAG TPA: signal peptide peptidase SppA [Candidatus Acidoferrales bacterium]|nr:signal peptide peptidase SppA [Candidatus Acidoferrales bacterium]